MFTAIVFGDNGGSPVTKDAGNVFGKAPYATTEEAKKGGAALLVHASYKQYYVNGYDILIIDMDAGKVVSRAKTEIKTLEWKDAA